MRIAILSPFYPYRGGIAQFSAMLYTSLQQAGCEVQAFNFKRLYPDLLFPGKTQYVEEGDDAIRIDSRRVLDSIDPLSYFRTVKEMKAWKPDVLVISYWMSFFVPGYAHVANRMKKHCKVITLIHNAIPHEPRFFDKPMAALLFRQSDGFIVMSENVKNDLQQLKPGANYLLSPHPLYDHFGQKLPQAEACKQLGISAEKKTLLFFGLIRDYKGLDLLIEAFSRLDDTYQLIIAGECYGSFDKYQQQIDALPDSSRVVLHNRYVQDNELPLLFSASDVLVLPYRSATQSGVVSVAYHFDVPMIGTPVGDFRQTIADTGTGMVTTAISAEALLEGITNFFDSDRQLFLQNIQKEKAALSWDTFTKKLLTFIETAL
ncbi:MAG: glycosyltransferase [Tannerellaceae bacterium]|nr:glycosyltransferase [Tannerellaceae bacterium]